MPAYRPILTDHLISKILWNYLFYTLLILFYFPMQPSIRILVPFSNVWG